MFRLQTRRCELGKSKKCGLICAQMEDHKARNTSIVIIHNELDHPSASGINSDICLCQIRNFKISVVQYNNYI